MNQKRKAKETEIEIEPDAWPRFERFIKEAAKAPQHRKSKPKGKRKPSKQEKK